MMKLHFARAIHQHGEARDVCEADMVDFEAGGLLNQDPVVREDRGERFVRRGDRPGFFERNSIAVDGEVLKLDATAAPAAQKRSSAERRRGA